MTHKQLGQLQDLAQLMLDHRLAQLRQAAEARAKTEAALEGLSATPPAGSDLQGTAAELAALAYRKWADARRAEINLVLARQNRDMLEARAAAEAAFGKAEALRAVQEKRKTARR